MERVPAPKGFKPFSVTLTFTTKEEYVHFHDNVIKHLIKPISHHFVGAIFEMGNGHIDEASGEVEIGKRD